MRRTKDGHTPSSLLALVLVILAAALLLPAWSPPAARAAGLPPAGTPRTGVDYVKMNVDWAAFFSKLKATGRDYIGRYLPVQGALHRCVTTTELAAAAAAGVDVFFWFETMNDLYRAGRGYAAGVADAKEALGALAKLGVPTTTPVYYTVDWNNTDGAVIDPYFKGIASVVPVSQIGAYGNYATVDWLSQRSMATYFCQSNAWPNTEGWHPAAQMHQDITTHSIGGVWVDRLTVTAAEFGQLGRYQQVDSRLLYSGTWSTGTLPAGSYSGGSYRYSTATDAALTIAFNGRCLDWIARRSPTPGTAAVSVDGVSVGTVDLYAPTTLYKQNVWSTGMLPDGLHTVTITRDGGTINVDALDVSGALVATTHLQENAGALLYSGAWTRVADGSASGSYYSRSNAGGAALTVHFTGQRLTVLAATGPAMGPAEFSVDGEPEVTIDLHGDVVRYRERVWTTPVLSPGQHVVTITRSASAPEGSYLNVDALEIVGVAGMPPAVTGVFRDYGSALGGRKVTIDGAGFTGLTGNSAVTFGGVDAAWYAVESSTRITAATPPQALGVVQVQVTAAGGSTDDTPADDYTFMPPVNYASLRGSDRYETAILISRASFPDALPAGSGLVLAPGGTFPEALCGAPLAAAWGGPVLLTPAGGLDGRVRTEILRLAPAQVFCVGLPTAVVTQVAAATGGNATVTSVDGAGGSVYDLSRRMARLLADKVGDLSGAVAIVTIGTKFPDAVGTAPLACARLWPIVLTDRTGGALHPSAAAALADLGITTAIKVGTYVSLPEGVTGIANLSGADRYGTNANVAAWAAVNAGLGFSHTAFATGDKFPDALAAGPYLALDRGTLLLSPLHGPVPAAVASVLAQNLAAVQDLTFIACVEPVIGQVKGLLP